MSSEAKIAHIRNSELLQKLGYDPGEWVHDWLKLAYKGDGTNILPLKIVGPTRTGKSNFANSIIWEAAKQGDIILMPGDAACEFRHFLLYIQGNRNPGVTMKILVPSAFKNNFSFFLGDRTDGASMHRLGKKKGVEVEWFDPYTENIVNFLEPMQILIVMDCCYELPERSAFWQYLLKQVKYRKRYNTIPVTYIFHEAGTYWPNVAFKNQYKSTEYHAMDFVEFGKFRMRGIYLFQIVGQFYWKIDGQFEAVIKKGSLASKGDKYDRKYGRGKRPDEYSISWSGIEDVLLKLEGQFSEMKSIWKVIPERELFFTIDESKTDGKMSKETREQVRLVKKNVGIIFNKHRLENPDKAPSITKIAEAIQITEGTLRGWLSQNQTAELLAGEGD